MSKPLENWPNLKCPKHNLFTQTQSLKFSLLWLLLFGRLATWEVTRYLLNIRLSRSGDSLICAVQIFSRPDWLGVCGGEGRGGEEGRGRGGQLGQIAVGEEIKKHNNTHTHAPHKHTLRAPSGEQVQSWSVTDALRNLSAAIPPVHLGWVGGNVCRNTTSTHKHTPRHIIPDHSPTSEALSVARKAVLMTAQVCITGRWSTAATTDAKLLCVCVCV